LPIFSYQHPFPLENGQELSAFELAYQTWGEKNADGSNVIWICHALTANADAEAWWPGLVGPGCFFDPAKYFIVCANMLGSCYGSTHALSENPKTGEPYYHDFPLLTNRDIVRAFELLRQHLGLQKVKGLIGGSTGGQHVLEWAIQQPEVFEYAIPIAANAVHSPWGIAFNEAQRMAIEADASWQERRPDAGLKGMEAARSVALLSYRDYEAYLKTQSDTEARIDDFRASSYQRYQGAKLARRFNAFSYWTLSKAMDSQDVGRGRGGVEKALATLKARTLAISIASDWLFPPAEQQRIAQGVPDGHHRVIDSAYGHDGFLIEVEKLSQILKEAGL
jgi:homoserine O-acetyltransferase